MIRNFFDRIAVRLVFWVVFWCSILTFADTFQQIYFEYRADVHRQEAAVDSCVRNHLSEVTRQVIRKNKASLESVLKSMIDFSGLAYAAVIIGDEVYCQFGDKQPCSAGCSIWPLWNESGADVTAGALEVSAEIKPLNAYLFDGFGKRLLDNGIKIFLIGGFTFFIVQALITRHLVTLAKNVRHFDFSKPAAPVNLRRRRWGTGTDELELVVNGLNEMQQRAQQAFSDLSRNEQRLLMFFNSTEEAILGLDEKKICTFANDKALKLLGVSEYDHIIGSHIEDLFYPLTWRAEGSVLLQSIEDSLQGGSSVSVEESVLRLKNGRKLPVSLRTYPVFQHDSIAGTLVYINDVSVKRELVREKNLLSEAVRQIPMAIIITDEYARIKYVNPITASLTGYARTHLIGKNVTAFIEKIEGDYSCHDILQQARNGKQWAGIIESYSKYGKLLKFFTVMSPVFNRSGKVVNIIAISREVSYEMAMRSELINAKKMDAVGRLSASFAHEFGNPLFGIQSVIKDLLNRDTCTEEDRYLLQLALEECSKMRVMVNGLQLKQDEIPEHSHQEEIETVINGVLTGLTEDTESQRVSLVKYVAPECRKVEVRGDRLSIVLRNILMNSIEAMREDGGIIDIRVMLDQVQKNLIIFIQDNGRGIQKEHQELILEPFFSTKPEVVGTGLGLSIAYWLVRGLGGEISFESHEGNGTIFRLCLPVEL